MTRPIVTPEQLKRILYRRALGDRVDDIAEEYNLEPTKISRLIHLFKDRFHAICSELGVEPPRHGGRREGTGRPKISDEKKARYTVNYHAYAKHSAVTFVTLVCLKCQEKFGSEDRVKERICGACKRSGNWRTGADFSTHQIYQKQYYE